MSEDRSAGRVDPFGDRPASEVAAVRVGEELDWPRLEGFLREQMAHLEGEFHVLQFPGGAANLTYLVRIGSTELVVRRPPFGALAPGAHDMRREFKVLSRLWRVFDRAPRAYVFCDDPNVLGADFFVMERRRGEVVRGVLPVSLRSAADVGRRIGFAVVDAMADLHAVDYEAAGLGDLGKPAGFVARQLAGWKHRWDLVRQASADAELDEIHRRLAGDVPESRRASIVHNDLKLDNCQFEPGRVDRVHSIFDWDMATLGDPLVDLGTLLNYWPDPADSTKPGGAPRAQHPGMESMGLPTRAEVVEHYARRTGADCSRAGWYEAFALWKTAIVLVQLNERWRRGESTDPRMETIAASVPALRAAALAMLDG